MANKTCEQLLAIEARWGREGRRAFLKALFARDDLVVCVWEDADAPDGDGIDMLVVKGQQLILAEQPVTWAVSSRSGRLQPRNIPPRLAS